MADLSIAAMLLDYLYPASVFCAFVGILIFDWFTLRTAGIEKRSNRGRRTGLILNLIIFLTYTAQVILNLVHALQRRGWDVPEHRIVGTMGDMFVWGLLSAALLSSSTPVWDPFVGAWLLSLAYEVAICGVAAPKLTKATSFDFARVVLQGIRISALVLANLNIFRLAWKPQKEGLDEEHEPLLSGSTTANGSPNPEYGAAKASDDSDSEPGEVDPDKDLKDAQRKRLESHGGWWGYIKEFKIFIPYLIPYKNRKVQACVVIIMINILLDRFVNVMVPRQLGIITDKLAEDHTSMPWKAVLVWVVLRWANSFASFGLISDIAHTHLHNWSSAQIKQLAFKHVMSLSMDFHSNKDTGDLIKSISQAESLNDLLETIFFEIAPILLDLGIAFIYITYLFDGAMAMVVVMVGFMFVWTSVSSTTYTRPMRRVYTEKSRAESKTLYECVSNWPTISYFNRTTYEENRYQQAVKEEMNAQLRYYILNSLGYALQYVIIYSGLLTVSMMAIFQISEGRKPIGNFVTLVMYWSTMMGPLHMISYQYRKISSQTVDAERLLQLLQTEPTVKNRIGATPLAAEKGKVVFTNVGFSYDDRKATLTSLNFTVEAGQTIALVGETGGGKSSTLKLLFRFYDVKEGSIAIDGQDIRDVTVESLREELGVVPQDPSLFNQTIMENVRYARLEASDEEVIEACKAAAVHDKIMSFPDQYRSKVGERGVKLSGGELQRVAIARVILKNPKIVLLDEATSAVDSAIEAQIQAAFKKLSAGRTTFVVAHRLSTIMEADLILVIDHGEIIERGTHEDLIKYGKKYFELWTKQTASKSSKANSKANSFLGVPSDTNPAMQNDLAPTTYSEEIKKAFIGGDDDDADQVTILSYDGACESKVAGCFGKEKQKSKDGEGGTSSSDEEGGPIRMVTAKPTQSSTLSGHRSSPASHDATPTSTVVQPPSTRHDSETPHPSFPGTRKQSSVAEHPDIPEVHIHEPKSSSSSSSANKDSPSKFKPIQGRKPTGYPRDMPGASDDAPSSSSSDHVPVSEEVGAEVQNRIRAAPPTPIFQFPPHPDASSSSYSRRSEGTDDDGDGEGQYFSSTAGTRRPTQGSLMMEGQGGVGEQREVEGDDDDDLAHRAFERFSTAVEE